MITGIEFPFSNLSDSDFCREIGTWIYQCSQTLASKDLYADIIENPDKNNIQYEEMFSNIESKYYDVKQTSKILQVGPKGFSIFHCNTRSLKKKLTLLNDILTICKEMPSIIAISETKLNENNINNISIPGYQFISKHSPTNAGSVGIYVKNNIQIIKRQDFEFYFDGVKTCLLEIPRIKQKNIIIGCIYRHPESNLETFHQLLSQKRDLINRSGLETYLTGDYNINFLHYSSSNQVSDYLDMLFSLGYMPLITEATRITYHSKTLIDHIYTNLVSVLLISQTIFHVSALLLLTFLLLTSKNSTGILPPSEKKNSSKIWKQPILCPLLIQMSMKVCLVLSTQINMPQSRKLPTQK